MPACASVLFGCAAGLDQALLGNAVQTGDKSKDDQHIHDLVKLGAHLLVRMPAWLTLSTPAPETSTAAPPTSSAPATTEVPVTSTAALRPSSWHPPAPRKAAARPFKQALTAACCVPTYAGDLSRHVVSHYLVQLRGSLS